VPTIRLSRAAENDLRDIAIYTLDNWSEEQSLQ
jgi:plasmid stabilization system protein ParE